MEYTVELDDKLSWLSPFIDHISAYVPKINKLKRVVAKSPSLGKGLSYDALCRELRGGKYEITLCTHYLSTKIKDYKGRGKATVVRTKKPFSKIDLLSHLAHELAHLEEWDHTPFHAMLEAEYTIEFMMLLEEFGYASEEAELEELKKKERLRNESRL